MNSHQLTTIMKTENPLKKQKNSVCKQVFSLCFCSVCDRNKTTRAQESQCNRQAFNQQHLHVVPGYTLVLSTPQSLLFSKGMKTEQPRS